MMLWRTSVAGMRRILAFVCFFAAAPSAALVSALAPGCWQASPPTQTLSGMKMWGHQHCSSPLHRVPSYRPRKRSVVAARQRGGDSDNVKVLRLAIDQKRNQEMLGNQPSSAEVQQLERYALKVSEQRSPVACDTLELGQAMEGRWRLALSSEFSWFLSMLPSADIFMDVDCKRQELAYVMQFRGKGLLLQQLTLLSRFQPLHGGSQLALLFFRAVLVVASKPLPLPLPPLRGARALKQTAYFDGDLWLERSGADVNVLQYHGPRQAETASDAQEQRGGLVGSVVGAVRGCWSVLWRAGALLTLTLAGLALILPPLIISYVVAAAVMAFSPFRDKSSSGSRLHRA